MTTNEAAVLLLIAYGAVMALAFVQLYLYIKCALLQKENRIYRQFFAEQYRMETDCLDACRAMMQESVDITDLTQPSTRESRQPVIRRISQRGAKAASVK